MLTAKEKQAAKAGKIIVENGRPHWGKKDVGL